MKPYDPSGHLKISAYSYEKSKPFYAQVFNQLQYELVKEATTSATWVMPSGFGIILTQATRTERPLPHGAPGIHHICFKATSRAIVDNVGSLLVEQGAQVITEPTAYPQYTPDYYAVFFYDPDGIKLEVAYY